MDEERGRIAASLQGDQAAFESLIREYQRMVHSLCYRMTGSMTDAEDLAQETFIAAYQRLDKFRGEARFSSWLYRIAVNQCLNWRKRIRRQEQLHQDWVEQEQVLSQEKLKDTQRVQDALLDLHPKQRAALILTIYDGLSHAEAARALGCSETTISWRVFAAKRKLRRRLEKTRDE